MAVAQQFMMNNGGAVAPPDPNTIVSGAGSAECDGEYVLTGTMNGRNYYVLDVDHDIIWTGDSWRIRVSGDTYYNNGDEDVTYPYLSAAWNPSSGVLPVPTVTSA